MKKNRLFTLLILCVTYVFAWGQTDKQKLLLHELQATKPHSKPQLTALIKLADSYNTSNHKVLFDYAQKADSLAKALHDNEAQAKVYSLYSYYYRREGNFPEALNFALLSFKESEKKQDEKRMGVAYKDVGMIYKEMSAKKNNTRMLNLGLGYALKALKISLKINDTLNIVDSYNVIAITHRDLKNYPEAYRNLQKALSLALLSPMVMKVSGAKLYNNTSQVYNEYFKDYPKALDFCQKALALNTENESKTGITHNCMTISQIYTKLNNHKAAIEYAHRALAVSQELDAPHRILNSYVVLSQAYQGANDFKNAFKYEILNHQLSDSLINVESDQDMNHLLVKYETEKKEQQIRALDTQNKLQWIIIGISIVGIVLLAYLGYSLRKKNQMIQESNEVLESKNQKIEAQSNELSLMMKELHHRVKNNLAIISSLLNIQSYQLKDREAILAVRQGKQRVEAMALIHQRLYQNDTLTSINIREYIAQLAENIMLSFGFSHENFQLDIHVENEQLDVEQAIPLGLILNELITNSFKYAYKDIPNPYLSITLQGKNHITLEVQDNGHGFDIALWEQSGGSFGKQLIKMLSQQLHGKITIISHEGFQFKLIIPNRTLEWAA